MRQQARARNNLMTSTVLLTNGRMPKSLDLARGLAAAGCRVVVAEPFRWHLCRVSRAVSASYVVRAPRDGKTAYLADLRAIIDREHIDLIVPVSEEAMHVAGLSDSLPASVRLFGMNQQMLTALHSKAKFIELAASLGMTVPRTALAGSAEAAHIARTVRHVTKPVYSCSGRGVEIHDAGTQADRSGTAEQVIVQEFISGSLFSTCSITHCGRTLVTSIYRGVVMSGTVAVCFERVVEQPAITRWVNDFIERAHLSGFVSFDFIVDAAGRAVAIECNPRVTSGVHFLEAADLAGAILDPGMAAPIRFRGERLLQQFWPCLTETQASIRDSGQRRHNLRQLLRARDVSWALSDPLPFMLMPATSYQILAQTMFAGKTFGEASTADISWFE